MTAGALRIIDGGGAAPRGWEALWAKDEWHQRELPHGDLAITYDRQVVLRFGGLAQPWLKEAAKRWARTRLLGSLSPQSMERYLRELMEFSRWLADRDVASPARSLASCSRTTCSTCARGRGRSRHAAGGWGRCGRSWKSSVTTGWPACREPP
jgi:hypothetical protein